LRTLVVTGDDFGASEAVNRAIAQSYDRGVLTSASLMVTGDAADEAVAMAKARPGLAVGLHLVLVDGRGASAPRNIPHLVRRDGRFRGGPIRAGVRYQFSHAARRELAVEIRAQLERFERTGLTLTHLDGHHHMHLHPVVLDLLTRADSSFPVAIPRIRLPREELGLAIDVDPGQTAAKLVSSVVFGLLRRHGIKRLLAADIGFSDRVYGLLATGRIDEPYLLALIPKIRANDVEIYCHPAAGPASEESSDSGLEELAALTSRRVREAIARAGFAPRAGQPASPAVSEVQRA